MSRKLFDPRNVKHRIVGAGAAIASGVVYAAFAGTSPPAAVVALAQTIGSLGTEFFAGGIQDELAGSLGTSDEVLRNHDLDRAAGQAVATIVHDYAALLEPGDEQSVVKAFASKIPGRWVRLSSEGEAPPELADTQLSALFAVGAEKQAGAGVLDPLAWRWLLDRLVTDPESGSITDLLGTATREQLGDQLHRRFAAALREMLKWDFSKQGRAYPAMVLTLLGDIRHAVGELGGRAVENGLEARFAALQAQAQAEFRTALQAGQAEIVAAVRAADREGLAILADEIRLVRANVSTRGEDRERHAELCELLRALQPQAVTAEEQAETVREYVEYLLKESRHRTLSTGGLLAEASRVQDQIREPELFDTFVEPMLTQRTAAGELQREVELLVKAARDPDAEPGARAEAERRLLQLRGHELEKLWASESAQSASDVMAREPALAALGDPGAGKSTLLRWVLLNRAQEILDGKPGPIPLFVTLPNYAEAWSSATALGKDLPLRKYLTEYLEASCGGLGAAVDAALDPGGSGVLLLLDGLDEVALELRRSVSDGIHEFAAKLVGDDRPSRLILTSRFFGYDQAPVAAPVVHVVLAPFNDAQVREFAGKWYWWLERLHHPQTASREKAERDGRHLGEVLLSHPQLTDLVRNPLLLTMVATAVRQGNVLPRRRVEFYELALKQLMTQWAHMRSDALKRPVPIDYNPACFLWAPIARWMHEQALPAVPEHELLGKLEERLDELESDEKASDWLSIKGDQSCLVQRRGDKLFGFLHQTFREYLAARDLYRNGAFVPELDRYISDPRWHEVLRLAAGYLGAVAYSPDKKPVTELIQRILNRGSDYESLLHRDLFLAALCLSDEVNPRRAVAEEVVVRLLEVAASPSVPEVVDEALNLFLETGAIPIKPERWREPVERLLNTRSWGDRARLARWLSTIEDPDRLLLLERLSSDPDADVAGTALAALVVASPSSTTLTRYLKRASRMWEQWRRDANTLLRAEPVHTAVQEAALLSLASESPEVRLRAAELLRGSAHDAAAAAVLVGLLASEDTYAWRLRAAELLRGTAHDAAAAAALVGLLASEDAYARLRAAELLRGTTHDAVAAAALVALMASENASVSHRAAGLLRSTADDAAATALTGLLANEEPEVRLRAAELLRGTIHDAAAAAVLVGLLPSEEAHVRLRAAELLRGTAHDAAAAATLVGLLAGEDAYARLRAAVLLRGTAHDAAVTTALVGLLRSKSGSVRLRAAEILRGPAHDAAVAATLEGLLTSEEAEVRQRAAELLRGTAHEAAATATLVGLLRSKSGSGRLQAAELLRGTTHDAAATATLVGLLTSNNTSVRLRAAELLRDTEPGAEAQSALKALEEMLRAGDAWPPDRAVAGHSLHRVAWLYATLAVREAARPVVPGAAVREMGGS